MKKYLFSLILVVTIDTAIAVPPMIVIAHLSGQNYDKANTNITVTAAEQTIFHFHSDFQDGGTWYDASISLKDGIIIIIERDSVSGPYKSGSKINTTENVYRLPADKIDKDEVQLFHGNRIVLTKEIKAAQSDRGK